MFYIRQTGRMKNRIQYITRGWINTVKSRPALVSARIPEKRSSLQLHINTHVGNLKVKQNLRSVYLRPFYKRQIVPLSLNGSLDNRFGFRQLGVHQFHPGHPDARTSNAHFLLH